jgi:hypothetical protein
MRTINGNYISFAPDLTNPSQFNPFFVNQAPKPQHRNSPGLSGDLAIDRNNILYINGNRLRKIIFSMGKS